MLQANVSHREWCRPSSSAALHSSPAWRGRGRLPAEGCRERKTAILWEPSTEDSCVACGAAETSSCAHARHTRPAWQHEGRVRRSPGIVRDSILFMFRREHCFFMFQREYCSPTSFHLNQTDITWTEMWHMHLISDFFFYCCAAVPLVGTRWLLLNACDLLPGEDWVVPSRALLNICYWSKQADITLSNIIVIDKVAKTKVAPTVRSDHKLYCVNLSPGKYTNA